LEYVILFCINTSRLKQAVIAKRFDYLTVVFISDPWNLLSPAELAETKWDLEQPSKLLPSPLYKVTHYTDWIHLTSRSDFRIYLLLAYSPTLPDSAHRKMGNLMVSHPAIFVVQRLKMSLTLFPHSGQLRQPICL